MSPNTTYWIQNLWKANCDGTYAIYNTSTSVSNPFSQRTRTVLPSVQSFTASNVITNGGNDIEINPIFFTNQPYAVFTLNASYAEGFSFQLVDN
ncbi:MAG: hypothetical protein IPO92_20000 [Saprospiraceae bacterium]|nr:hypothetical protein [Saprospiraceae bacterium]